MIPRPRNIKIPHLNLNYRSHNTSMMTRCNPRSHIPRPPHVIRSKRPTMRHNPIHYIRSPILLRILLSILPQKPRPNTRNWMCLTPNRNSSTKSIQSSSPKHRNTSCIRRYSHMSPSQTPRTKTKKYISSPSPNNRTWSLLYIPPSKRIPRSLIQNCRQSVRSNIFRSNRIPWPSCTHWINISNSMFMTNHKTPILNKPPLRI